MKVLWLSSWNPRNIDLSSHAAFRDAWESQELNFHKAPGTILGIGLSEIPEQAIIDATLQLRRELFISWSEEHHIEGFKMSEADIDNLQSGGPCYVGMVVVENGLRFFHVRVFPPRFPQNIALLVGQVEVLYKSRGPIIGLVEEIVPPDRSKLFF